MSLTLAADSTTVENLLSALQKRDSLSPAEVSKDLEYLRAQRVRTAGHLLRLYLRKDYWNQQVRLSPQVRKSLEDALFGKSLRSFWRVPLAYSLMQRRRSGDDATG